MENQPNSHPPKEEVALTVRYYRNCLNSRLLRLQKISFAPAHESTDNAQVETQLIPALGSRTRLRKDHRRKRL